MSIDAFWPRYLGVIAKASTPPEIFGALRDIVNETVGNRLLTASVYDMGAARSRRVFSENETAYPVGGFKPQTPGKWYDTVMARHEIFASLTIEEIAEVFFDWRLIQSLGFESNLNLPVVVGGEVIGTINLLERQGFYTPDRVAAARTVLPFAVIAFLAAARSGALASPEN